MPDSDTGLVLVSPGIWMGFVAAGVVVVVGVFAAGDVLPLVLEGISCAFPLVTSVLSLVLVLVWLVWFVLVVLVVLLVLLVFSVLSSVSPFAPLALSVPFTSLVSSLGGDLGGV